MGTPTVAHRDGIRAAVFDWDGTLTVAEGVPTRGHVTTGALAHAVGLPRRAARTALATLLFGGTDRMRHVGAYLTRLHRAGLGPWILTRNPVADPILTDLLRAVAPGIPRRHWERRRRPGYAGSMGPSYDRMHILHSLNKPATLGQVFRGL